MPRSRSPAIPPAPRKTLLEWIESDDGHTADIAPPACSKQAKAIHAQVLRGLQGGQGGGFEALNAPAGLPLPPLG